LKLVVVVKEIGAASESWMWRQLQLLNQFDLYVFTIIPFNGTNNGIKIKTIGAHYDFGFRITKLFANPDISKIHQRRLLKQLKSIEPDAILFHYIEFALAYDQVFKIYKDKVFIHCHGYDITWDLRYHHDPEKKKFEASYIKAVRQISKSVKFIANSTNTKNHLLEIGIPDERIFVKYFSVRGHPMRHIPHEFTICYVGRLVDFKGPDYVISAFEHACRNGLQGQLILAGDGPLRSHIELIVRRSSFKDRISVLGEAPAEKVEEIYLKSSIFTAHNCKGELTNQEEAFGVSVIEAMSYGLPVITGNSGGVRETVVDGKSGYLIEPFNVKAHANAFIKLFKSRDLLQEMSHSAQKHSTVHFSEEMEMARFKEIFVS
jgi:glycosyltransferase involved in cell wall biosynthesis